MERRDKSLDKMETLKDGYELFFSHKGKCLWFCLILFTCMIAAIYGCRLTITLSCGLSNGQFEGNVKVRLKDWNSK